MRRSIHLPTKKQLKRLVTAILAFFLLLGLILSVYFLLFTGKIYPNTFVAGVSVGGMSPGKAAEILSNSIASPEKIELVGSLQSYEIETKNFNLKYDFAASSQRVYNATRTGNIFFDFTNRIWLIFEPKNFGLITDLNEADLDKILSVIAGQVSNDPVNPTFKLVKGEPVVNPGKPGTKVDLNFLRAQIGNSLAFVNGSPIEIPLIVVDNSLTTEEVDAFKLRLEKYIGKSLKIKFEYNEINLKDDDLIKLLDPKSGYNKGGIESLAQDAAVKFNRDPQNSKFVFENGRVNEFMPSLEGISVDKEALGEKIIEQLSLIEISEDKLLSFEVPVIKTPPEITTDEVNNLGINELIGRGASTYFHSIASRVHNVSLAASRINGTLVKPGEIFSFNNALGDVSQFTGYQQAYIISDGKTILGDGGGVCQVSTTLFRSILDAGLPVTERQAHAYRVGYYEQDSPPGLDATVYGPTPDLKFKNDTPGYILIEATANPKNYSLVLELYGTSDGRVSTISKPSITNVTPPPDDLYQDDPTLPTGTVKQIDFKAWGAKVTFNYTVTRDGQKIYSKTFISNYRPWQAIFLRGTAPAN